jgi:hypothetical protein
MLNGASITSVLPRIPRRAAAGHLATDIHLRQGIGALVGTDDCRLIQRHPALHQRVAAIAEQNHVQATAVQQASDGFLRGEMADQCRAGQAFGQGRLKRQRNTGLDGNAGKGSAQRPGGMS